MKNTWKPPGVRKDQWPVMKQTLELMSRGISTQVELRYELDILPNRMSSLVKTLSREELIVRDVVSLQSRWPLALIRMNEKGKVYSETFCDVQNIHSEWENMIAAHQADKQPKHTAMTLYFAHFARMSGWDVQVVPGSSRNSFMPDILVKNGQERYYFEIETKDRGFPTDPTNKWYRKWAYQRKEQLRVAVCTLTPGRLNCYRDLFAARGWPALLTDLDTLRRKAKSGDLSKPDDLFEIVTSHTRGMNAE